MKEEAEIPIVEIHIKEIKDFENKFETPVYTMEPQTNEDRLFVNWRPISSAPRDYCILLAIKYDGVYVGWYSPYGNKWKYADFDRDSGVNEENILGWYPIPDPPTEKIILELQKLQLEHKATDKTATIIADGIAQITNRLEWD